MFFLAEKDFLHDFLSSTTIALQSHFMFVFTFLIGGYYIKSLKKANKIQFIPYILLLICVHAVVILYRAIIVYNETRVHFSSEMSKKQLHLILEQILKSPYEIRSRKMK